MADRLHDAALHGRKHGDADGRAGKARDPRPDFRVRTEIPGYAARYAAACDVAYNNGFMECERILREAVLRHDRDMQHRQAMEEHARATGREGADRMNRADSQAEIEREI